MLKKFILLILVLTFQTLAQAASGDIKCRVNQIQAAQQVRCEEKYTFPALCLTLECLSKAKFICKGSGKSFKVKFFYRYRQSKDQHDQYSAKPVFVLKRTEFSPAEYEVETRSCD